MHYLISCAFSMLDSFSFFNRMEDYRSKGLKKKTFRTLWTEARSGPAEHVRLTGANFNLITGALNDGPSVRCQLAQKRLTSFHIITFRSMCDIYPHPEPFEKRTRISLLGGFLRYSKSCMIILFIYS